MAAHELRPQAFSPRFLKQSYQPKLLGWGNWGQEGPTSHLLPHLCCPGPSENLGTGYVPWPWGPKTGVLLGLGSGHSLPLLPPLPSYG